MYKNAQKLESKTTVGYSVPRIANFMMFSQEFLNLEANPVEGYALLQKDMKRRNEERDFKKGLRSVFLIQKYP